MGFEVLHESGQQTVVARSGGYYPGKSQGLSLLGDALVRDESGGLFQPGLAEAADHVEEIA